QSPDLPQRLQLRLPESRGRRQRDAGRHRLLLPPRDTQPARHPGRALLNPYEAVGVLFGVISVWLTVREDIWCWPTGLVNVSLFVMVFGQARLYADMGLRVVYVILSLYGWYEWLHGGETRGERMVARTPAGARLILGAAGLAGLLALGQFLHRATDAAVPFW